MNRILRRPRKQLMEYIKEVSGHYNALNYGLLIDDKSVVWEEAA